MAVTIIIMDSNSVLKRIVQLQQLTSEKQKRDQYQVIEWTQEGTEGKSKILE